MGICFHAVGDWGYNNHSLHNVAQSMKQLPTDFLALLGDNFYPFGVSSKRDKQWEMFEHNFGYLPCYAILGNHDYLQNPYAQIAYRSPFWNMPHNFYDMQRGDCHFFFIDTHILAPMTARRLTEDMGRPFVPIPLSLTQTHLQWLQKRLLDSRAKWKIVFGHIPIYSGGMHGDNPELQQNLLPILQKARVDMYISGHDHNMQHIHRDGCHFFVLGSGCGTTPCVSRDSYCISICGFGRFELQEDKMFHITFLSAYGNCLYRYILIK